MGFWKLMGIQPGACFGLDEWSNTWNAGASIRHGPGHRGVNGAAATTTRKSSLWRARCLNNGEYRSPAGCAVVSAPKLRQNKGISPSARDGKIKPEGDGEVQEMIDIGTCLGQSACLRTDHAFRTSTPPMYEQWHPHGIVGVISAFNFPVAVWA
jgi:aldehyde dehydrogenase (NAD+)